MAVTSVNVQRATSMVNSTYESTEYMVPYLIITDDKDTPLSDILNATGVPAYGDESTEFAGLYCLAKTMKLAEINGRLVWMVEVKFSDIERQAVINDTNTTIYSYGTEDERLVLWRDQDGNAILNSAGDPFNPTLEYNRKLKVITIEREEDSGSFDDDVVLLYTDTVNEVPVTINGKLIPKRRGFMRSITATFVPEKNRYKVTYVVLVAPTWNNWGIGQNAPANVPEAENAWVAPVLNQGLRQLDANGKKIAIINAAGDKNPISEPVLLDANGQFDPNLANPVYRGFRLYKDKDWTALAL